MQHLLPIPRHPGKQYQAQPVALSQPRSFYLSIDYDQLLS
jgi:hypothetical protein